MNGIVLELQKEAMDKKADIESLLRKSYVIAVSYTHLAWTINTKRYR